ncbi:MAG: hemin uptake protein HemP [Pseudomonadota bacterium]
MAQREIFLKAQNRHFDDRPAPVWSPGESVDSRQLLGTSNTVTIRHGQEAYTLRETRAGKLILTK